MTTHTIHLNGTSRDELVRQYLSAYRAFDTFAEELADATIHPRDFYPQGENAYAQAVAERKIVLEHLNAVQTYLAAHLENLTSAH